jgi:putative iron-regulated protein
MRELKLFIVIFVFLASCAKRKSDENTYELEKLKISYINQLEATHKDLVKATQVMDNRLSSFYQFMTFAHFEMSKTEWKNVYRNLNYFGPYRFADASNGHYFNLYKDGCSSWPVNMNYVDYTQSFPNAGFIQDPINYPELTNYYLHQINKAGDEQNLSLGMHVIEFLLWGEDLSSTGPGNRPTTDYSIGDHSQRRRICLYQLNKAFLNLVSNSKPDESFKKWFLGLNKKESLYYMLSGIYHFVRYDFAENSINKPLLNGEAFEESRFSDNSLQDLKDKLQALNYLFKKDAYFTHSKNYGLYDYIEHIDPSINASIIASLGKINDKLQEINLPLDTAITDPSNSQRLVQIQTELILIANKLVSFASSQGVPTLE